MAANLDYAFLVMSLNDNLILIEHCAMRQLFCRKAYSPVAVLTKADLCENVESLKMQFKKNASSDKSSCG